MSGVRSLDNYKRKTLRITVSEEVYEQLRVLAEESMRTVPVYSRQIILRYLRKVNHGTLDDGWDLNERTD